MKTAMESLKEMIDVNTVIGDPVETQDGTVIIPVSRVAFGFAAGGGEYGPGRGGAFFGNGGGRRGRLQQEDEEEQGGGTFPFGGGSGAGVSVQPVGFLICGNGQVRLLAVRERTVDRLLDTAPEILERAKGLFAGRQGQAGQGQQQGQGQGQGRRGAARSVIEGALDAIDGGGGGSPREKRQ